MGHKTVATDKAKRNPWGCPIPWLIPNQPYRYQIRNGVAILRIAVSQPLGNIPKAIVTNTSPYFIHLESQKECFITKCAPQKVHMMFVVTLCSKISLLAGS